MPQEQVILQLFFHPPPVIMTGMSLEYVIQHIQNKLALAPLFNATVKFDFQNDGVVFIDATQNPPDISQNNRDADVTFICPLAVFNKILEGQLDPTMAYMTSQLKIKGSMGLAMKLSAMLEE